MHLKLLPKMNLGFLNTLTWMGFLYGTCLIAACSNCLNVGFELTMMFELCMQLLFNLRIGCTRMKGIILRLLPLVVRIGSFGILMGIMKSRLKFQTSGLVFVLGAMPVLIKFFLNTRY